jgi:diguanylate cyclase (GGDEF)-like protein/putative nucleotidyltransferase with HDIG domain
MWIKPGKTSLKTQFLLLLGGLTLSAGIAMLLAGGVVTRRYFREQLRNRLMGMAATGALLLDAEAESRLQSQSDERSKAYKREKRRLQRIRDATPGTRYVYTMRPHPDPKRWSFIVDAEEDPQEVSHLGDRYNISDSPEMWEGLRGPAADREFVRDKWGIWLSGYAPVKDRRGRTVALLGLDTSASEVLRLERAVLGALSIVGALCLLVAALLGSHVAGRVVRPVAALVEGTKRVAGGDLSAEVSARGSRELAALGESFNIMTRALRAQHDQLVELSHTDFLTSLKNHRYFQERLEEEISRVERHRRPLSIVLLDIDNFRSVNSAHGHKGGDDVLRQVAATIKDNIRTIDIAARYGGEEFGVILPEENADEAYAGAERVRAAIERSAFAINSLGESQRVHVTVSGGVAEFPADSHTKDGMLVAADLGLLRAKYTSRNRICRYRDEVGFPAHRIDPAEVHRALQSANVAAVESLAQALDARDHYTRGHSDNVTRIALAIAKKMGLPTSALPTIRIAGLLHDIGKIGVPDRILNKKGRLTAEEWKLIRAHPEVGASILMKAPLLSDIVPIVRAHHERYDGKGYPGTLQAEEIPLAARILAVADAYDAMTSHRPYRPAMSREQCLAELHANASTQFDPKVLEALETSLREPEEDASLPLVEAAG